MFVEETASPVANSKQPSQQGLTREVVLPGINSNEPSVTLAIRMRLGDTEEIFQLPVTQEMISRLMFEAHVREINVAELLAELITAKLKTDFGQPVPNGERKAPPPGAKSGGGPSE